MDAEQLSRELVAAILEVVRRFPPAAPEVSGAPNKERSPTVADIKSAVCEHFGLPLIEMTSERQSPRVVRPRQIAMFLALELTPHSMPAIGLQFGGRDRTTVRHAKLVVERELASDLVLAGDLAALRSTLRPPLVTASEAARQLRVHPAQITRGVKSGLFRNYGGPGWPLINVTEARLARERWVRGGRQSRAN
jgi:hypothetical protein